MNTHLISVFFPQQLSKFLQTMQKQHNLVRVKELTKGVESIVEVDWKNPKWAKPCLNLKKFLVEIQTHSPPTFRLTSPLLFLFITLTLYRLRSFHVPEETDVDAAPVQDGGEGETLYHPPEITTLYSVSARLEPLFLDANKRCVRVFVCFPNPDSWCFHIFARFRQQGVHSRESWSLCVRKHPQVSCLLECDTESLPATGGLFCSWPRPLIPLQVDKTIFP